MFYFFGRWHALFVFNLFLKGTCLRTSISSSKEKNKRYLVPLHQDLGKTESVQCLSDHGWNLVTIPYQSLTTDIQQVRWGFLCGKLLVVIMEECSFRTKEEVIKSGETPSWQTCAWGCSTNASNTSDFLTVISGCLANAVKAEQPAMISF